MGSNLAASLPSKGQGQVGTADMIRDNAHRQRPPTGPQPSLGKELFQPFFLAFQAFTAAIVPETWPSGLGSENM